MRMRRPFFSVLVNFKRHLEAWNVNYSVLSCSQWISVDANILETMQRKTAEKKIVLVRVDKALDSQSWSEPV